MKKVIAIALFASIVYGAEHNSSMHMSGGDFKDKRISLGLPDFAKQRLLKNMRGHLETVQKLTALIAEGKFDEAAKLTDKELGLSTQMLKECKKMDREDYKKMGFAFHDSAKVLQEALKSKDTKKSLNALSNTLNYCVSCHATFRQ